jgi:hypothetical protein
MEFQVSPPANAANIPELAMAVTPKTILPNSLTAIG